jgi:predicted RNA-binding protein with RPS1 domain
MGYFCAGLAVGGLSHFSGGTVCFVQRITTILTVGDAVQANIPIAIQHGHLVLNI